MFSDAPAISVHNVPSWPSISLIRPQHALPLSRSVPHGPAISLYVTEAGRGQVYLVAAGKWGHNTTRTAAAAYGQIAQVLKERQLEIVQERVFGSLAVWPTVRSVRSQVFQCQGLDPAGPLTFVQGQPPWGMGLSGIIIRAVQRREPNDQIWTIRYRGRPVGRGWRRKGHATLILQNLQGLSPGANGLNSPPLQTRRMLEQANLILKENGATYRNVMRTWFYLSDILSWYPEFNQARTAAYREFGFFQESPGRASLLPASTGIQGEVPTGASGTLDLLAVTGDIKSRPVIRQLSSPGQPEAFTYGSAFSRGALIKEPDVSLVQVSGTASINQHGQSLYLNNIRAQIDCTFEKLQTLISQLGTDLTDVAAACVFVKRAEHARVFQDMARARGLENFPAVVMVADVCRPELLFEIDAEAVVKS